MASKVPVVEGAALAAGSNRKDWFEDVSCRSGCYGNFHEAASVDFSGVAGTDPGAHGMFEIPSADVVGMTCHKYAGNSMFEATECESWLSSCETVGGL